MGINRLKCMKTNGLELLLHEKRSVFTTRDISLLWRSTDAVFTRKKIHRYVVAGKLHVIRRGVYAKDIAYDPKECATRLYTPSYISFETVLAKAGIIFQYYTQIHVASYITREISVGKHVFAYRKIKNSILLSDVGIEKNNLYSIATPERAFLDTLYLNTQYHFDNTSSLDWQLIEKILPIYGGNKRMKKMIEQIRIHSLK
jgi:hypothetical protein